MKFQSPRLSVCCSRGDDAKDPQRAVTTNKRRLPYECGGCGAAYPTDILPWRCARCGGLYRRKVEGVVASCAKAGTGMVRWADWLGVSAGILERISLGEGNTPLRWIRMTCGAEFALKVEGSNPTGCFKDRGTVVLMSAIVERGIRSVVEDSSGNAAASLAAYAARAGIHARVFVPEVASGAKMFQIALHGGELVRVRGPRAAAMDAAMSEVRAGAVYASHAHHAFQLAGYATVAFELADQLGELPGTVVVPAGQGGLLLGLYLGFCALTSGQAAQLPTLVGVQAAACAPLARAVGVPNAEVSGETCAEGIRVERPVRAAELINLAQRGTLEFVTVCDEDIWTGREELARRGFGAELTSAIIWEAVNRGVASGRWHEPVVGVLTAHALKTPLW